MQGAVQSWTSVKKHMRSETHASIALVRLDSRVLQRYKCLYISAKEAQARLKSLSSSCGTCKVLCSRGQALKNVSIQKNMLAWILYAWILEYYNAIHAHVYWRRKRMLG